MSEDQDIRRRRAVWRACHRGTKELDLLVGNFAARNIPAMSEAELSRFEAFLAVTDPELQRWLLDPVPDAPPEHIGLVADVRRFHGLGL